MAAVAAQAEPHALCPLLLAAAEESLPSLRPLRLLRRCPRRWTGSVLTCCPWQGCCAAVASELLAEQGMGAAPGQTPPTAAQLRRAQASALAFRRLVQNMKTSLGRNYLANLLGYSGGEADDDAQLDARVDHACLALCPSDAVLLVLSLCGEDDNEDSMADGTDEEDCVNAEEAVSQCSSSDEPSAPQQTCSWPCGGLPL